LKIQDEFGMLGSGAGTPVNKPNHLEIMGNGSTQRSTNGKFTQSFSFYKNFKFHFSLFMFYDDVKFLCGWRFSFNVFTTLDLNLISLLF
jgi:hypothetical protein